MLTLVRQMPKNTRSRTLITLNDSRLTPKEYKQKCLLDAIWPL